MKRIEDLYMRAGLPIHGPSELAEGAYLDLMAHDKKVIDGKLRLVLLKGIGQAVVSGEAPAHLVAAAIRDRSPAA